MNKLMTNSRARRLRSGSDVDVRAEVTGDPPVIEIEPEVFAPANSAPAFDVQVCPCCGVVLNVEPARETVPLEMVRRIGGEPDLGARLIGARLPLPTYQRALLEGGAA